MFAYSSKNELVSVFLFDSFTKRFELIPSPLELVIPVSHLTFRQVEEHIEFLVGRGDEAKLWLQVAKNVIDNFGDIL
jgi:hypothetical protein